MPLVTLTDRAALHLTGAETKAWFDNVICGSAGAIPAGEVRLGALLAPQGKILFDFLMMADPANDEALWLDVPAAVLPDLVKRLTLYRLRAKIAFSQHGPDSADPLAIVAGWGDAAPPATALAGGTDMRAKGLGQRWIVPTANAPATGDAAWLAHRLALGIPEGGVDFAFGDAFPHEAVMDMLGGIDARKGCYVGQEVVSRMQHRGTARTRLIPVTAPDPLPAAGTELSVGERVSGRMGSSSEGRGLAMVRLDRVGDGIAAGEPLHAAGTPLTPLKPDWWSVAWPGETVPAAG